MDRFREVLRNKKIRKYEEKIEDSNNNSIKAQNGKKCKKNTSTNITKKRHSLQK